MFNILRVMVVVLALAGLVTREPNPIHRVLYSQLCLVYLAVKLGAIISLNAASRLVALSLPLSVRTSVRVSAWS